MAMILLVGRDRGAAYAVRKTVAGARCGASPTLSATLLGCRRSAPTRPRGNAAVPDPYAPRSVADGVDSAASCAIVSTCKFKNESSRGTLAHMALWAMIALLARAGAIAAARHLPSARTGGGAILPPRSSRRPPQHRRVIAGLRGQLVSGLPRPRHLYSRCGQPAALDANFVLVHVNIGHRGSQPGYRRALPDPARQGCPGARRSGWAG